MVKNPGAWITGLICVGAVTVLGATFLTNASPYVTVAEALKTPGTDLHLAGDLLNPEVHGGAQESISFTLRDQNKQVIPVEYTGEAIENLGEAKKVVAIGGMENGVFVSHKLLIKCPSKYTPNDAKSGESNLTSNADSPVSSVATASLTPP